MAITAQTPYNSYTGNGSATVYAYTFKVFTDSDLAVYVDGTLKTLTTDYTVSGAGTASGGDVTFGAAPANGLTVLISRAIPYNRTTDYQANGDLLADTLDDDLDRIVCQVQQLEQGRSDSVSAPFPGDNYTANNRNIENLADPVNAQDADTKAARDAAIVSAMLGSPPNDSITTAMLQDEAVITAKIDDEAVTFAKIQNIDTARLLGRTTASSGDVEQISVGDNLTLSGGVLSADAQAAPSVRQTVYAGPVDSAGQSAFGGSTGSTTVTASGTLKVTAAGGQDPADDRKGSITNPSFTGLSTNGTMYLYIDVAADGTCTAGSTTLAPVYQFGGTYSTTNGQFTFNISEMTAKVGNGSAAVQAYRVFIGQVTVAGGVVSTIIWYAINGRYISPTTSTLPSASAVVNFNHNLGVVPKLRLLQASVLTAEYGFVVGDIFTPTPASSTNTGQMPPVFPSTSLTIKLTTGDAGWLVTRPDNGNLAIMTLAYYNYWVECYRGW